MVTEEARTHPGPQASRRSWASGGGTVFCWKSILLRVCHSQETEPTQETQELGDCQAVSQRPKQTVSSVGEKPGRQTKRLAPWRLEQPVWPDGDPLLWVGQCLPLTNQLIFPVCLSAWLVLDTFLGP